MLDEIDDSLGRTDRPPFRQEIHGQLTYLLAQQFIDGTALLAEIAREAGPEEAAEAACACGRNALRAKLARVSFGAGPRPDSPVVIKSQKIFSICRAAKKGGTLELSPEVNIILSGGLK